MSTPRPAVATVPAFALLRLAGFVLGCAALLPTAAAEEPPAPAPAPAPAPVPAPAPDAPAPDAPAPEAPPTAPPAPPRAPGAPSPGVDGRSGGPATPPRGDAREAMWKAPTAEDWAKPCLLTWQRSWDDAVAVSKETKKPIMVCINMDGEIASEHYAGVRYRQPEIAALYEPYVTVIASVYRHNPRDFDDEGKRIPCPRFGGVTCGEHIRIEPVIFEKFCDGQRVAPRHILVDLEGKESFDVYYRNDTASVFADIQEGFKKFPAPPPAIVRGDRPVVERVASREVSDRAAVEAAYEKGDAAQRRALLDAALKAKQAEQLDLLRLAVFGFDPDLSRVARKALSEVETPTATKLIVEALKVPMDPAERDALLAALKRLGISSPLARWLGTVHQGVAGRSSAVDPAQWTPAPATAAAPPPADWDVLEAARARSEAASKEKPEDAAAKLELAEASIALAREAQKTWPDDPKRVRQTERHLYAEARRLARDAAAAGAPPARTSAVLAVAAYQSGDRLEAYARAAEAAPKVTPGDPGFVSLAVVTIFAESRFQAIRAAVRERKDWPPEWLTDLHAAYEVLLRHPLGRDEQVLWHYDFLVWLGADDEAGRVLSQGLGRFKKSQPLHDRLLTRALAERGPEGLEAAYKALLAEPGAGTELFAYAANASVVAAEHHRRMKAFQAAVPAYGRAIELYEKALAAEPASKDAYDHAIALAFAGRARVDYQLNDDERALADILASFARRPASAGTRDGVGVTPGETAQMLRARLRAAKKDDLVAKLQGVLDGLDPELLKFDRE